MNNAIKLGVATAMALLGSSSLLWGLEVREADRARLDRAKIVYEGEAEQARKRYLAAMEQSNQRLRAIYERLIEQYRRADPAVANALASELDTLIAATSIDSLKLDSEALGASDETSRNFHADLIRMIGPELVLADGSVVGTAQLASVKHVMLYFSAGWCGPCKKFTPDLVKVFDEQSASRDVMVILVSGDRNEAEMLEYMRDSNMKWAAVPFKQIKSSGLLQKYGARGIPNLVLLDTDGAVKSASYVDDKYVGPKKVLNDFLASRAAE